jgi:hypothetical protein
MILVFIQYVPCFVLFDQIRVHINNVLQMPKHILQHKSKEYHDFGRPWKTEKKGNVKSEQTRLPVPRSADDELGEIKKYMLLLSDIAHSVQTGFQPIEIWCILSSNVNTVNLCLSAHNINWPEASG